MEWHIGVAAEDRPTRDTADPVSRNVEIVVGQFEAVNARDFAAAMEAYAEDVTLTAHGPLGEMVGRTATGKKAVGDWFGDWFQQFAPDYRFQIEDARGSGDLVFIVATHSGRGRAEARHPSRERRPTRTRSAKAKSAAWSCSPIATRPSKPPGCRSSARGVTSGRRGAP